MLGAPRAETVAACAGACAESELGRVLYVETTAARALTRRARPVRGRRAASTHTEYRVLLVPPSWAAPPAGAAARAAPEPRCTPAVVQRCTRAD